MIKDSKPKFLIVGGTRKGITPPLGKGGKQ